MTQVIKLPLFLTYIYDQLHCHNINHHRSTIPKYMKFFNFVADKIEKEIKIKKYKSLSVINR